MRRTLYDADHEAFRGVVRTFISKEIVPHDAEWNAAGIVPRELFTAAGAQGLIGWAIPEESGRGRQAGLPVQHCLHRGSGGRRSRGLS